ncbi:group III truncated hemoglobin [Hymenobacter weizhouensis]|uniref:group III truncated hemoglobin n=1 Tax=Hymenobacter sp. YIM 151500-1 TaxID=2987689 RepID=UPI0022262E87|nr:group III truncated hemoglobin [Hymenobacter sp. YIM 151500-1]UYZ62598.1 group III truncated hemoglobin [Hymenobacter sp. YIM 151500-1]
MCTAQAPTPADISTEDDIQRLVDSFYGRVRTDELLGPIFAAVVQNEWPRHLATMYDFWSSLLLGTSRYRGRPFPKHLTLPIDSRHFRHWLTLFVENVDAHFAGPTANLAIQKAGTLAAIFEYRVQQAHNPYHVL